MNLQLCDFLRASGRTRGRIFFRNFGDLSKRVDILPPRLILSHSLTRSLPFRFGEAAVADGADRPQRSHVACGRTSERFAPHSSHPIPNPKMPNELFSSRPPVLLGFSNKSNKSADRRTDTIIMADVTSVNHTDRARIEFTLSVRTAAVAVHGDAGWSLCERCSANKLRHIFDAKWNHLPLHKLCI